VVAQRRGLVAFGLAYAAAFGGAGSLILDRAGNMGSDYAASRKLLTAFTNAVLVASLWAFLETRLIMHRNKTIPGSVTKREGYPLSMANMSNLALASTGFRTNMKMYLCVAHVLFHQT
jgi:hypothetical protein